VILGIPKKALIVVAVLVGIGWIYIQGSGRQESGATEGGGTPAACRMAVEADVLNVRGEPAADAPVVGKLRQDAEIDAEPVVQNGFRKIAEGKWAAGDFLEPVRGAVCG